MQRISQTIFAYLLLVLAVTTCFYGSVYASQERTFTTALGRTINLPTHVIDPRRTVYHHDSSSGELVSHEEVLALHALPEVDLGDEATMLQYDATAAGRPPVPISLSSRPLMRYADGVTAVFDHRDGALLHVSTPEHDLLPLPSTPGVFAARSALGKNSSMHNDLLVPALIPPGKTTYTGNDQTGLNDDVYFDVIAAFDNSFCALYRDATAARQVIQALFRRVRGKFSALVDVRLVGIFASCRSEADPFAAPSSLLSCAADPSCSPAAAVLDVVSAFFLTFPDAPSFDAAYLISGYDDGTAVAGAAYLRSACVRRYSYGWIEATSGGAPSEIVLAHEIAHTLGARHSARGFMQSTLAAAAAQPYLAARSAEQIKRFIAASPKGCLTPAVGSTGSGAATAFAVAVRGRAWIVSDIAFGGQFVKDAGDKSKETVLNNVYTLYASATAKRPYRYALARVHPTAPDAAPKMFGQARLRKVPSVIRAPRDDPSVPTVAALAYAAGTLMLFFVRNGAVYSAAGSVGDDGVVLSWDDPIALPSRQRGLITAAAAAAYSRPDGRVDVLLATTAKGTVSVEIGMDVGPDGAARGGWTAQTALPVASGDGDIGVELLPGSASNSGSDPPLELLVSTTTRDSDGKWHTLLSIGTAFELLSPGTAQWTTFEPDKRAVPVNVRRLLGSVAAARRPQWGGEPMTIFAQAREVAGAAGTRYYNELELGLGLLRPPVKQSERDRGITRVQNPASRCAQCFSSADHVAQCERRLEICLSIGRGYTLTTLQRQEYPEASPAQENEKVWEELDGPDVKSIGCEGFHHVYLDSQQGCSEDVPSEQELAAGAAVALADELEIEAEAEGNSGEGEVVLQDFDFVRAGEAGGGDGVTSYVNVVVWTKKELRRQAVRQALNKLRRRPQYIDLFRWDVKWARTRKKVGKNWVWVVKFKITFQLDEF